MKELVLTGVALVLFGLLIITVGAMLSTNLENAKIESAGIIMIGPIPIMFGNKRLLLPLAILAIVLMIVFYILFWRQ